MKKTIAFILFDTLAILFFLNTKQTCFINNLTANNKNGITRILVKVSFVVMRIYTK